MGHSGQGNEASELDGDRQLCVFCFCSSYVTCVKQQWLGHGQDAHKRNSGIKKKLYRNFCMEHGSIIYTFVKLKKRHCNVLGPRWWNCCACA